MRRRSEIVATLAAALCCAPHLATAQSGVLLQGIVDAEGWSTDSTASTLLTRNHGSPGTVERLNLWTAVQPWSRLVAYGLLEAEGGPARPRGESAEWYLEQAGLRLTASDALVIEAGKMPQLLGAFAARRFSTRNPLIGEPDGYPVTYPWGVEASGTAGAFDYRVAGMSKAPTHQGYTPDPGNAIRPEAGFGVTPFIGFRLGASGTVGPYLNNSFTSAQLAGESWQHYQQRVAAGDLSFSRGYLEVHGEYAWSDYQVPTIPQRASGWTYYVEPKYTLTPRLFVAGRWEVNDYPFVGYFVPRGWISARTDYSDWELGGGYRFGASTLLKASYRTDHRAGRADGHAIALQLSQAFDVMDWVDRPQ